MEKKCLIISYHFFPSNGVGAKRYNLFSKYFSNKFNTVNILTIKEKYLPEKDETLVYGGEIYRTRYFPRYQDNEKIITKIINRIILRVFPIDRYSAWIIPALVKGIKIVRKNKINTIIVTGPPFSPFLTAYLLSFIFKIDLIIDYQDPWVLADDYDVSWFKRRYTWFFEKLLLKNAKYVIFNTQTALNKYFKQKLKFAIENKSFVIPNPYLCEERAEPLYLEKNKKVIIYAGNFYGNRRLKYIFKPLKHLFNNGELNNKVSIHVFGKIHEEDADLIKELNLSKIITEHKWTNYSLLASYMKGADILYLAQGDDHRDCVPYKLTDYLTIRKPILAVTSFNSATYDLMQEVDCGIAVDMDDTNSIYNALKELLIDERNFSFAGTEKYSLKNTAEYYYKIIIS